jgi:hypothetical protein
MFLPRNPIGKLPSDTANQKRKRFVVPWLKADLCLYSEFAEEEDGFEEWSTRTSLDAVVLPPTLVPEPGTGPSMARVACGASGPGPRRQSPDALQVVESIREESKSALRHPGR